RLPTGVPSHEAIARQHDPLLSAVVRLSRVLTRRAREDRDEIVAARSFGDVLEARRFEHLHDLFRGNGAPAPQVLAQTRDGAFLRIAGVTPTGEEGHPSGHE